MPDIENLRFATTSYAGLADEHRRIQDWLTSLGYRVTPTRLGAYSRYLERIEKARQAGTLEALLHTEGTTELIAAVSESLELTRIYKALSPLTIDPELRRRLADFIKGPTLYADERPASASNHARDIALELSLGAALLQADLPVDFHPAGDLRFVLDGCEVFVECKRPQELHQVRGRIKGAFRQLTANYAKSSNPTAARGLVALSITKALNPTEHDLTTQSRETLSKGLLETASAFIRDYGASWQNPEDARTIGCLIELRAFVFIRSESVPQSGVYHVLTHRAGIGAVDMRFLSTLSSRLEQGMHAHA
jgi:hypothetical protein